MKLLDLFCGAGGASVGYAWAGFDVVGVDIAPHSDYPFELIEADALEVLVDTRFLQTFDAVHASPPCQGYTTMSNRYRGSNVATDEHPRLIAVVRSFLAAARLPYVIENVPGARPHMLNAFTLTGGMFGLRVERPRLFESNVLIFSPEPKRAVDPIGVYGRCHDGRRLWTRGDGSVLRAAQSLDEGAAALGIDWMTDWADVTEAIPPAYTEWIGRQLRPVAQTAPSRGSAEPSAGRGRDGPDTPHQRRGAPGARPTTTRTGSR